MAPFLSIVIPILNERGRLPQCLDLWRQLAAQGAELIVVDGGSEDGSAALVQTAGFRVVHSMRGRARQMNAGAHPASGEWLLFLHADTVLSLKALDCLVNSLAQKPSPRNLWGRFDIKIEGSSWFFPVIATMINLRSRITGIATGDQCLFVNYQVFKDIGGFPDQPLMEDVEISKRLLRLSRPLCVGEKITTSGRRWEKHGVWSTILLMWRLRWRYWRGASPEDLARSWTSVAQPKDPDR